MDYRSLSSLLMRLTGVIVVVSAMVAAPNAVIGLTASGGSIESFKPSLAMIVFAAFFPLMIGLILIWFPAVVTNRVVGGASDESAPKTENDKLEQLAFSMLGLYFLAVALFDAVFWYARAKLYYAVIVTQPVFANPPPLLPDDFAGLVSACVQLIVGLLLMFGNGGLRKLLAKVRS